MSGRVVLAGAAVCGPALQPRGSARARAPAPAAPLPPPAALAAPQQLRGALRARASGAVASRAATQRCRDRRCFSAAAGLPASAGAAAGDVVKIAVFVSGGGSNFKAVHAATVDGRINGRVVLLVSDKAECGGVSFARAEGIPVLRYPAPKDDPSAGLSAPALLTSLREAGVQLVLLAGYLKLVPPELCRAFPRGVLNIHPALLPAFGGKGMYGARVHAAVLASGAWFSGPTVHFVDEEYDRGVILAQRCVPVLRGDTPDELAHRVLEQEWRLYPAAVAAVCAGRVTWRDDGVPVIDAGISHDNERSS